MESFRFFHPIEVRYGDLDPQGHLNNAKYLTYFEQGRIAYIRSLGLWQPGTFDNIGIILADAHIQFRAPVQFGQPIQVGVRVTRLGNRSLDMEYRLEDQAAGLLAASGSSVLVAYDYINSQTMPIPDRWREVITAFEQLAPA